MKIAYKRGCHERENQLGPLHSPLFEVKMSKERISCTSSRSMLTLPEKVTGGDYCFEKSRVTPPYHPKASRAPLIRPKNEHPTKTLDGNGLRSRMWELQTGRYFPTGNMAETKSHNCSGKLQNLS
ncbi:hypothetical protein TNCV_584181 [Trichonephila clavipes]|nr:hypothetical protein TNCV_584181 [Trichonephila clavipes]